MGRSHWVMDYETNINCFLAVFEDHKDESNVEVFTMGPLRNDIAKLLDFFDGNIEYDEWHVSFNGLAFDAQITQHILVNRNWLLRQDGDAIGRFIYKEAQEIIGKSNRREFQKYSEKKLSIKQIDVFKLNHWDNPAKRSSLKWIQCSMDWYNVQDMPIDHTAEINNVEDLKQIASYCRNDVASTKAIMVLATKQITLRGTLTKQYGINLYNASEPRIAKELFLYFLEKKTGISGYELKQLRTYRNSIPVNDLILPYTNFDNVPKFKDLLLKFRELVIDPNNTKGGFKYSIDYRGVKVDFGLGGVHGAKRGIYIPPEGMTIMSSDVVSYYPNLAIRNGWSPAHLPSEAFTEQYEWFFIERKKIPKSDPRNYVYKIILNATYGLSNDKHCYLYDPQFTMRITINGQLSLMMLFTDICENIPGAVPIMTNTDGVEIMIPDKYIDKYHEICTAWEETTNLALEHDEYQKLMVPDVNNYIGVFKDEGVTKDEFYSLQKDFPDNLFKKIDGKYSMAKTKCKGRFEFKDRALHKNKSFTVVSKALYKFFVHGIQPEEYLKTNKNIFDFCGQTKARGVWKFKHTYVGDGIPEHFKNYSIQQKRDWLKENGWEESWSDDNWVKSDAKNKEANTGRSTKNAFNISVTTSRMVHIDNLQKTLRYYVSNKGTKIIKNNTSDGRNINVEAGKWVQTIFNLYEEKPFEDYDIDLTFYLFKINKEIKAMQPEIFANQIKLDL